MPCLHEPEMDGEKPLQLYLIGAWDSARRVRPKKVVRVCQHCGLIYADGEVSNVSEVTPIPEEDVFVAKRQLRSMWACRNKDHNIHPSVTDAYTDGFYDGVAWATTRLLAEGK